MEAVKRSLLKEAFLHASTNSILFIYLFIFYDRHPDTSGHRGGLGDLRQVVGEVKKYQCDMVLIY